MKTLEEAFDAYRKEVADYARIVRKVRKANGGKIDYQTLDETDYVRLQGMSESLRMAERVLGLTPEEISRVEKENGLVPGRPKKARNRK